MSDVPIIRRFRPGDASAFARLYRQGVPNAIFCALGSRFLSRFFAELCGRSDVCGFVAENSSGEVIGVIVGTLDHDAGYRAVLRAHRLRLLWSAGLHLLRPRVLVWVARGVWGKIHRTSQELHAVELPQPELLIISIDASARGSGLAKALVDTMETAFVQMGYHDEYSIFTEAVNERANRFYCKIGAVLADRRQFRGRVIHAYRKQISAGGTRG